VVTHPNQLGADFGNGLVLGKAQIRRVRWVPNYARIRVAEDVRLPLPARGIGVAGADELGLEPLELLLGSKLVGLEIWR
jgi:hypothetical protein